MAADLLASTKGEHGIVLEKKLLRVAKRSVRT